jgi:hypothetical protein
MKIRQGFVSNSSSSSFVIPMSALTPEQLGKIHNHIEEGKKLGMECCGKHDAWHIKEASLSLSTNMDNFDMYGFLSKIGVDMDKVDRTE